MMDVLVVIPARFESSRYPGKPLADIAGKSLVKRVWERCARAVGPSNVVVATESDDVRSHCEGFGADVVMTSDECLTGTDRVAEVSKKIKSKVVVNVQGDEPLVKPSDIHAVIAEQSKTKSRVVCGMCSISSEDEFRSSSVPKVVTNMHSSLLYMSRGAIPTNKSLGFEHAKKQVCIYAFDPKALKMFGWWGKKTTLEAVEDIEILRFLEMGIGVQMVKVSDSAIAVDYKEDVAKVEEAINNDPIRKRILDYDTWYFDCDGVLLDSNKLKTDAFYEVALPYGEEAAKKLVEYHKATGGVSRYEKMAYLQTEILGQEEDPEITAKLSSEYGSVCHDKLLACDEAPGLRDFLDYLKGSGRTAYVVSGGSQEQLRDVFAARGLNKYFDGIYGSPTTKDDILRKLAGSGVFIGDSKYDYVASNAAGHDFIFMNRLSEFKGWARFFAGKEYDVFTDLADLHSFLRSG